MVPLTKSFWIIIWFDPHINRMWWSYQRVSPFYRCIDWDGQRLSDLSRVTQLESVRARIWTLAFWTPNLGPGPEWTREHVPPITPAKSHCFSLVINTTRTLCKEELKTWPVVILIIQISEVFWPLWILPASSADETAVLCTTCTKKKRISPSLTENNSRESLSQYNRNVSN